MTTAEYGVYKRKMQEHGYKYLPNQPFDGSNSWVKHFVKEEHFKAKVVVREFDHREFEDKIQLGFYGSVDFMSEVSVTINPAFGYAPDLDCVDRKMAEIREMAAANEILPPPEEKEEE